MGCAPSIPYDIDRAIRKIHRSWFTKWNTKINRWEIWGRTPLGMYYMVDRVQERNGAFRPLDARIVKSLQRAMWLQYDPKKWRQHMNDDDDRQAAAQARIDRAEEDFNLQVGKDAYRPMQMMARDLGFDSGKNKIPTIQGADIT